jgi:hypothetical protein
MAKLTFPCSGLDPIGAQRGDLSENVFHKVHAALGLDMRHNVQYNHGRAYREYFGDVIIEVKLSVKLLSRTAGSYARLNSAVASPNRTDGCARRRTRVKGISSASAILTSSASD